MKKYRLMAIVLMLIFSACIQDADADSEKIRTADELFRFKEKNFVPNHSFYDEFPEYKNVYKFNQNDEEIIGPWSSLADEKKESLFSYIFYPNNLFIGNTFISTKRENTYLSIIIGLWSVENDILVATIYTFQYVEIKGESRIYSYEDCKPYRVELININDLDSIGYSRRAFKELSLPENVR